MSSGELIGLLLTIALLAAVCGAVGMAAVTSRPSSKGERRARQEDAYARWLAAHRTLTRASISFVAAFRALAADRCDARYSLLRREEAQRARAAWCDAQRELDRAEALLLVRTGDGPIRSLLGGFNRASPQALQTAIHGGADEVDELTCRLQAADERAVDFVCSRMASARVPNRSATLSLLRGWIADSVSAMVDQWSRR